MNTGHDRIDHINGKTCNRTGNASAASSRDTDTAQHLFSHRAADALQKGVTSETQITHMNNALKEYVVAEVLESSRPIAEITKSYGVDPKDP